MKRRRYDRIRWYGVYRKYRRVPIEVVDESGYLIHSTHRKASENVLRYRAAAYVWGGCGGIKIIKNDKDPTCLVMADYYDDEEQHENTVVQISSLSNKVALDSAIETILRNIVVVLNTKGLLFRRDFCTQHS